MQQSIQLYINDQLVDLSGTGPIPLSFQINDLADVQNQAGNTSKQFTLALTQKNRAILGFPDDITLTTEAPYRQYSAKFVQDGVEVIPAGVAEINKVENMTCDITVLSGNVDFFDAIDGQIVDMGDSTSIWSGYGRKLLWAPYDHIWNVENAAYSQKKTDGWIWPIIDYGNIPLIDNTAPINVRAQRPAFFLHTAVEILVAAGGYRIDYDKSSLIKDPLYKKLLIPFANGDFEHGTDFQNTPDNLSMIGNKLSSQSIHLPGSPASGEIPFDQMEYTATQNVKGTVTVQFNLYMKGHPGSGSPSEVTIGINVRAGADNVNVASSVFSFDSKATYVSGSGGGLIQEENFLNCKITADIDLVPGMVINVNYSVKASQITTWIMRSGALFEFQSSEKQVLYQQMIQCERILPDVSQKDFLKDTLQRFGILCQCDNINKKITFASFKDIVANIPNAIDWSEKMVDQGKQVYFKLGNYNQINWMRYQPEDSILLNLLPRYFADDKIIIDDQTLNTASPISDLFMSIYAPSINVPYKGGTIAQILKIDRTTTGIDFAISTQPRLLVDQKYTLKQKADGTGEKITFTAVDGGGGSDDVVISDVISTPYFYKGDGQYNLCYCDKGGQAGLRKIYYPEVEHILQRTKKIVRYFKLTPQDIKDLDFLTPVYLRQDSGYFYINKIDSWTKGVPVKVELVRL